PIPHPKQLLDPEALHAIDPVGPRHPQRSRARSRTRLQRRFRCTAWGPRVAREGQPRGLRRRHCESAAHSCRSPKGSAGGRRPLSDRAATKRLPRQDNFTKPGRGRVTQAGGRGGVGPAARQSRLGWAAFAEAPRPDPVGPSHAETGQRQCREEVTAAGRPEPLQRPAMETRYNLKSPAVKRLMKEAAELKDPTDHYHAQPLEDNLFEWHFTVRGPPDSDFDGGVYHGRIVLPPEYPMKPPSIILLTANGRFEVGKKICLSISGHHPETWQPSWSIRTALLAIIGFMPTKGEGAIGSLDYTPEERKALAKKSQDFCCEGCGSAMKDVLLPLKSGSDSSQADQEAKELARQISFKAEVNSSGKTIAESDLNHSFSLNDIQDDVPTTFQGATASTSV
ncbi:Hypothetical predicted protein, partial [Marmota monax]